MTLTKSAALRTETFRIAKLFLSMTLGAFLAFVTQLILGRNISIEAFGLFSSALSIIMILASISGSGIPGFLLLKFGAEGWAAIRWIKTSILVQLIAFILIVCAFSLWSQIDRSVSEITTVTLWLLSLVILQIFVDIVGTKFQLEGKYGTLALWQILPNLSKFLAALYVVYFISDASAEHVAKSYLVASLPLLIALIFPLQQFIRGKMELRGHDEKSTNGDHGSGPTLLNVLEGVWPFAASAGLVMLYGRVEIVLLGTMLDTTAAGLFAVASAFLLVAYLVPQAVFQKYLMPKMHRWFNHDFNKFVAIFRFGCGVMLLLGIVSASITCLAAPFVVPILFGEKYAEAGTLLSMLSVCIALRFITTCVGTALVSRENMKRKAGCQFLIAIISITVASICIARFGLYGAVISKIVTECALLTCYLFLVVKYVMGVSALKWKFTMTG